MSRSTLMKRRLITLLLRDGPECWICGYDTDPNAEENAPEASSVDHVILSKYGGDDLENLRVAHRECNTRRDRNRRAQGWEPDAKR